LKPETGLYLDRATEELGNALSILTLGIAAVAARCAYYAAFHAAEALIFERTGKAAKTHAGVHSQFAFVAKDEPNIPTNIVSFLKQTYQLKDVGDYGIDPSIKVSMNAAENAISGAQAFVAQIRDMLA
jgi:uncharacterized protein (UPF0332 family)